MLHQSFFLLLLLLSVYGHFIHNFSTDRIFFFLLVFVSSAESLSKVNYETRNKRRKKREKHTRGKIRKTVGNKKSCIFHKRQSTKEKESRKKERKRSEITKRYGCSLFSASFYGMCYSMCFRHAVCTVVRWQKKEEENNKSIVIHTYTHTHSHT